MADLLELLPGSPPHAVLVTSCGADVAGLPAPQTLQGQALQHGVDLVIASRRRLTPDEVDTFSAGFYGSANFPNALDMAARDGRRALYEGAKIAERRVGGYAWASFTIYEAHGVPASRISKKSLPEKRSTSFPDLPQWLLHRPDRAQVIVIQTDHDGYQDWYRRVEWWSEMLAKPWQIREVQTPESLASSADALGDPFEAYQGPLIRMHDWTKLTNPQQILDMAIAQQGKPITVAVPDIALPIWDVIAVRCAPEMLIDASSPRSVIPIPTAAWPATDLPPGSSHLGRWLSTTDCNVEPDTLVKAIDTTLYPADEQFDSLLTRLTHYTLDFGHRDTDLVRGLISFSAGFYHNLDRAPGPDADPQVYEVMRSFCDISHLAGLTRRKVAGRFVLDVFHPRLAAAIRRCVESRAEELDSSWAEWRFRVSVNAPELGWHIGRALPRPTTLSDRLKRPDRILGPELAAVTARNYVFYSLTALRVGDRPTTWWEDLESRLSHSDRRCFVAIRGALAERTGHRAGRPRPAPLAEEAMIPPEAVASMILALAGVPSNHLPSMLMPTGSKDIHYLGFEIPESISHEWLQNMVEKTSWPEDQAWYYWLGAFYSAVDDPALAEDLVSRAIELSIVADGPHALAQCLDALHTKAAVFRLTGRWNDWNDVMNIAVGLLRNVDWTELATSVDELLEEVSRGDLGRRLRFTGELLRAAADRPWVDLTQLIIHRSMALGLGGRFLEADELLNGADLSHTTKRDRSIVLVTRAEANLALDNYAVALDLCADLMKRAEGSILAHACLIEARVGERTGDYGRALRCYERGWAVEDGGKYADIGGYYLCRELLGNGELDRCIDTAEQVRLRAHFPFSARACLPAAVAASIRGEDETVIRSMLMTAFWALDSEDDAGLVWTMALGGYEKIINEVLTEVDLLAEAWMLGRSADSAPPEVNVDRSEFSRYRLNQLLRRASDLRRTGRTLFGSRA